MRLWEEVRYCENTRKSNSYGDETSNLIALILPSPASGRGEKNHASWWVLDVPEAQDEAQQV
jgi:hypothetical protein